MTQVYIRDEHSSAIINTDEKEYNIFLRERAKSLVFNSLNEKIHNLENRIIQLEEKLKNK